MENYQTSKRLKTCIKCLITWTTVQRVRGLIVRVDNLVFLIFFPATNDWKCFFVTFLLKILIQLCSIWFFFKFVFICILFYFIPFFFVWFAFIFFASIFLCCFICILSFHFILLWYILFHFIFISFFVSFILFQFFHLLYFILFSLTKEFNSFLRSFSLSCFCMDPWSKNSTTWRCNRDYHIINCWVGIHARPVYGSHVIYHLRLVIGSLFPVPIL